MRKLTRTHALGAFALLAALCGSAFEADALTVQPVLLDLRASGRGMNQTITVENNSAAPTPVELTMEQITFEGDQTIRTGVDPGDLVVFPSQAVIQPGQTQVFRVQYVGDPALTSSKHYYITVAQVPVLLAHEPAGVQIVYNFEVLASVGPRDASPALRVESATIGRNDAGQPAPVVNLTNDSATYGYLSRGALRIIENDATGHEVFRRTISGPELQQTLGAGLIVSHQQRRFTLPVVLPLEDGTVMVRFTPDR